MSASAKSNENGGSDAAPAVFRLPRTTYLIVLFLAFGTVPLAFTADNFSFDRRGAAQGAPAVFGWQTVLLVIPVLAAFFIARTATFVDSSGIRVRALFGTRRMTWDEIRGLSITEHDVYAVVADGSVRLPCVHVNGLAAVSCAAGGRLPEIANPRPKFAPSRRRRRR